METQFCFELLVQDGSAFQNEFVPSLVDRLPSIRQDVLGTENNSVVEIDDVICKFTLNVEQFRMFIGGPGGTGKSRIIHALNRCCS